MTEEERDALLRLHTQAIKQLLKQMEALSQQVEGLRIALVDLTDIDSQRVYPGQGKEQQAKSLKGATMPDGSIHP